MNIDRAVLAFAGAMVLLSAVLAWLVSPYWLLLAAFIGLNLIQASFTGFCPAAMIFSKLGMKSGCAFNCSRRVANSVHVISSSPRAAGLHGAPARADGPTQR